MGTEAELKPVPNFLQAEITDNKSVFIQSIDPEVPLSDPVYAINWFNTRSSWMYQLYNLLAASSVRKVFGKPFFKGRVTTVLHGDQAHRRDMLLIVHYPAVGSFKAMLETRYFQLVSILRVFAVRQFTFGFSRRSDTAPASAAPNENKAYAIHHYRGGHDISAGISDLLKDQAIDIFFTGRITSLLFSGDGTQAKDQVPCMMDGAVILQAETKAALENTVAQAGYQSIIGQTDASFIAIVERML